jgi:hypothetical protein
VVHLGKIRPDGCCTHKPMAKMIFSLGEVRYDYRVWGEPHLFRFRPPCRAGRDGVKGRIMITGGVVFGEILLPEWLAVWPRNALSTAAVTIYGAYHAGSTDLESKVRTEIRKKKKKEKKKKKKSCQKKQGCQGGINLTAPKSLAAQ